MNAFGYLEKWKELDCFPKPFPILAPPFTQSLASSELQMASESLFPACRTFPAGRYDNKR